MPRNLEGRGLFEKVRDIRLQLVSVTHGGREQANEPGVEAPPIKNRAKEETQT